MPEFALIKDGATVAELRRLESRPPDLPAKGWQWLPVVRETVPHDAPPELIAEPGKDRAVLRVPEPPPPPTGSQRLADEIQAAPALQTALLRWLAKRDGLTAAQLIAMLKDEL